MKGTTKIIYQLLFLRAFVQESICKQYFKIFVVDFIFSKIPCFQHIHLDRFRQIDLKYENYSLGHILFQTLTRHSDDKSFIAKTFGESRVKMKATSPVQEIKNKKKCFQLCLGWTNTSVLTTYLLRARQDVQVRLRARKVGCIEKKLSTPVKAFFSRDIF